MEKRNAIIIILLLLTFGLLIHGFKKLHRAHWGADHAGIALSDVDDTPYHVSSDEMDADRQRVGRGGMHLQGSAVSKFNSYDFSGGKVIAADAKAKEEVKKKKKKTAKDKGEEKPTTVVTDVMPYYDTTAKNPATDADTTNPNVVGTVASDTRPQSAAAGGTPGANTNSYQEWATLLLNSPTIANVNKLVAAYKDGSVSAQVFYEVLEAMETSQNTQDQTLAVTAASDVPSAQSFEFLVQITKVQNSQSAAAANTAINGYSALNEVPALKIVMTSYINDAVTIQDATTVLLTSAETYIANRAPTAAGAGGSGANLSAYSGFIAILNNIIKVYANNATIVSNASAALNLISTVVTQ